ncbi:MAG: DUF4198 domain-containing protein [Thiolinea sp.]
MGKKHRFGYLLGLFLWLVHGPASAHEFWIEPLDFTLQTEDTLLAHLKVGQMLVGNQQVYLPDQFESFELIQHGAARPINSRLGDRPPVHESGLQDGLAILAYASTNRELRYSEAEKFQNFLDYEGLAWVKAVHQERELPPEGFKELYRRYGKSLVKIGAGQGQDQVLGFPIELVLLDNPYQPPADKTASDVPVQLLWQGKPFADAQISVFSAPPAVMRWNAACLPAMLTARH